MTAIRNKVNVLGFLNKSLSGTIDSIVVRLGVCVFVQEFVPAIGTAKNKVLAVKFQGNPVSFWKISFTIWIFNHDVIDLACRLLSDFTRRLCRWEYQRFNEFIYQVPQGEIY